MKRIHKVTKMTDNKFLNLYHVDAQNRVGKKVNYYVASRWPNQEAMKLSTHDSRPDGVVIYALTGKMHDKVVLIRQYRFSIDDYIYEFPAGLVDPGESFQMAAVREMKEETGLDFHPLPVDSAFEKPYYTTIGMTDECCATAYGYADGIISREGLEDNEDIEVVLADKEEAKRILKEERVAIMCAYMLMHFIADEEPFAFLQK